MDCLQRCENIWGKLLRDSVGLESFQHQEAVTSYDPGSIRRERARKSLEREAWGRGPLTGAHHGQVARRKKVHLLLLCDVLPVTSISHISQEARGES